MIWLPMTRSKQKESVAVIQFVIKIERISKKENKPQRFAGRSLGRMFLTWHLQFLPFSLIFSPFHLNIARY